MKAFYDLKINQEQLFTLYEKENLEAEKLKEEGKKQRVNIVSDFKKSLDRHQTIDASEIVKEWFPVGNHYDVFLSYAHSEVNEALSFAGFLKHMFNYNVFIDNILWKNVYDLIEGIYSKKDWNNEKARNDAYANAYILLSTSIMSAIDNSQIAIFMSSDKATYNHKDMICDAETISPWIYEELFFANIINKKVISIDGGSDLQTDSDDNIAVRYRISSSNIVKMDSEIISNWVSNYKKGNNKRNNKKVYGNLFEKKRYGNLFEEESLDILFDLTGVRNNGQ